MGDIDALLYTLKSVESFDPSAKKPGPHASYEARAVLVTIAAKLAMAGGFDGTLAWWMEDLENEGYFIQYISIPTEAGMIAPGKPKQLAWHMTNDCERVGPNMGWDGHSTEEKYRRIRSL